MQIRIKCVVASILWATLSSPAANEICQNYRNKIEVLDAAFSEPILKDSASLNESNLSAYHDAQEFAEGVVDLVVSAAEEILVAVPPFDSFDYYLLDAVREVSRANTALSLAFFEMLPDLLESPEVLAHYHALKDAVYASKRASESMYFKALYVAACRHG